jgi:hypothetical protein
MHVAKAHVVYVLGTNDTAEDVLELVESGKLPKSAALQKSRASQMLHMTRLRYS